MFENFFEYVGIDNKNEINNKKDFIEQYSGCSFLNGIYRIHNVEDIKKWTKIVEDAFPKYKNNIKVFGYDWLGRQFAENIQTKTVLMFEPGTGEVLNIPVDFVKFHDKEIADYNEDSLASSFFKNWYESSPKQELQHNQCVGYKVPLFLNGNDDITNLEVSDMEYDGSNDPLIINILLKMNKSIM